METVAVAGDGSVLDRFAIDTVEPAAQGGHAMTFRRRIRAALGVARWEEYVIGPTARPSAFVEPSASAPSVTISEPLAGAVWDGERATVRWAASDADGDELEYLVEYSHDDGATWIGVAMVDESEVSLSVGALDGGSTSRVRVWASDGVRSGVAEVGPFTVARRLPFAHLRMPVDGAEFRADEGVLVDGDAFDQEGNALETIEWRLDGRVIEATEMLDASALTPGEHVLTLRATDATGLAGQDESRFVVLAPATSRVSLRVTGPERLVPGATGSARVTVTHVSGDAPVELPSIEVGEHHLLQLEATESCTRPRHRRELRCTVPEPLAVGASWSFDVPFVALEHGPATVTAVLERPDSWPELAQLLVDVSGITWETTYDGEEGRAPATVRARNTNDVTEPSGFELVLPLPLGAGAIVPASDDWRCERGYEVAICAWRGAEVPAGVELPDVRFEAPPPVEGTSASEVVFDVELTEPAAGTSGTGTVVARNVGEVRHSRDLWFVRRFERSTVASAVGEGWSCRLEANEASCVFVGGLEVGAETPTLSITLDGLASPNVVTEIVEHPAAKPPGAEVRYLVEVRNEGEGPVLDTVTARGTWPEGETVLAATGESWACEFSGRDFSCRYYGGVVLAGAVLPRIALFVRIADGNPDVGGSDAGVGDLDAGFDGGVPFDGGVDAGGDVGFDGGFDSGSDAGSDGSFADAASDTNEDSDTDVPTYEGVQLAIDGYDACNRIVDPVTGELTPRPLGGGLVVVDPLPGMPYCYSVEQVPSNTHFYDGVPSDPLLAIPGHVGVAYDAPRQARPWRYFVRVRNLGLEAFSGPVRVRVTLPRDMTFRAVEGRSNVSSVTDGWTCVEEPMHRLLCTSERTIAAGRETTFRFGLRTNDDAWREQHLSVELVQDVPDEVAADDRFEDRLSNVVQAFGPPADERFALDAAKLPSRVDVRAEAPSELQVDTLTTLRAFVESRADETLAAESVHVRLLGAPSFVHVRAVRGEGWRCVPRWGDASCTYLSEVAPGEALPGLEVDFLPGPQPGEMSLPVVAFERDRAEVGAEASANVQSSERPDVGTIATSGCAPYADCWPTTSPLVSGGIDRSPRLQVVGSDGSLRGRLDVEGADTRGVAFVAPRFEADGSTVVFAARGIGGTVHRATHGPDGWRVDWSHASGMPYPRSADVTSDLVAFTRGTALVLVDRANDSSTAFWNPSNDTSTDPQQQWKQVALSPDGTRVVALRGEPGTLFLGEITRSSTGTLQLSSPVAIPIDGARDATFSPDGSRLALSAGGRIAIVALDGSDVRLLTDGGGSDEVDVRPAWSLDGSWLAFERGAPDEVEGRAAVRQDVAIHRAVNRGVIPAYRDAAIFTVPSAGGEPWLVVRGRTPAWMPPHTVEPTPLVEAPTPRSGEPTILLAGARELTTPGTVDLSGRASAVGPIEDGGRFLFAFDRAGRGTLGRTERELVRSLAQNAAPAWVAACDDGNALRCGLHGLLEDVARQPGATVAARSFVNNPNDTWGFDEDLAVSMGAQPRVSPLSDSDEDGVPDLAELAAPRGTWPRGVFPAATAVTQREIFGVVRDGFDAELAELATAFDAWPGDDAKVAYLVTQGRSRVDATIDGAVAALRARDVRVHTLVPPAPTVPATVVVVAGRGLEEHGERVDALLRGLDEAVAETGATMLTIGDPRIARGDHFPGEAMPGELIASATSWLRGRRAAGSFTHLVVVTPGERDTFSLSTLESTFRDGVRVHAMLPPGYASRPIARCGNPFGTRFVNLETNVQETGGVLDSLCGGALEIPTHIAQALREGFVDECSHPDSAAAAIARLTGGRCAVLDETTPPLLSWSSTEDEDSIVSIEAELDGVHVEVRRREGLFSLSPTVVAGSHELVLRMTTAFGRVVEERTTLRVNTPPVATADTLVVPRSGVETLDVLANDIDADGDVLRLVSASGALFGNVSCNEVGSCTYVDFNPSAQDEFTYVIDDGRGGRATGRVVVQKNVNAAPIARPATFAVAPSGSVGFDLASYASDPDGDALVFELPTQASVGYLDCEGTRCVYAGAPESGSATFFYRVRDSSGAMATAEVTLTVSAAAARLNGELATESG
ncbi:MAG: Ig-like domain-containing protein, partial [Polyangiales bacterium]